MISKVRIWARKNALVRRFFAYYLAPSGLFDWWFRKYRVNQHWHNRINDVVSCPDNQYIERCEKAGQIIRGKQVLHNGIKIHVGSYYGPEYTQMLRQNKGVHEPQEEKVFAEVLRQMPAGAVMVELGAFWAFYSMWFNKEIKAARNYLVEPDDFNGGQGKRNFRLNGMKGEFIKAFVGARSVAGGKVPTICIDDLVQQQEIQKMNILHSDIQGHEYDMLLGAERTITEGRVDYIFISTHANDLHYACLDFLREKKYRIIAEADLDNTYSEDGLIVAAAPGIEKPGSIPIAHKRPAHSQPLAFGEKAVNGL